LRRSGPRKALTTGKGLVKKVISPGQTAPLRRGRKRKPWQGARTFRKDWQKGKDLPTQGAVTEKRYLHRGDEQRPKESMSSLARETLSREGVVFSRLAEKNYRARTDLNFDDRRKRRKNEGFSDVAAGNPLLARGGKDEVDLEEIPREPCVAEGKKQGQKKGSGMNGPGNGARLSGKEKVEERREKGPPASFWRKRPKEEERPDGRDRAERASSD